MDALQGKLKMMERIESGTSTFKLFLDIRSGVSEVSAHLLFRGIHAHSFSAQQHHTSHHIGCESDL